jgi:Zn-dependent protease
MNGSFNLILYQISIWAIPAIIAITFHEASHGYVAHLLGDDTAWRLGRVSFNPLVHIDPFGTVVLPLMLLMLHSPFLFGYAKPVPVNFSALRHPRLGTILVAAAGPGMNLLLATIAVLALHIVGYDFQSSADSAPRWRTHTGGRPSWCLGTCTVSCRALRHADTHRSDIRAATAWRAVRH